MKKLKYTLAAFPIFFIPMFWQTWVSGIVHVEIPSLSLAGTFGIQTLLSLICAYCVAMLLSELKSD